MYHKIFSFFNKLLSLIHPSLVWIALILAIYWLINIYNYQSGYKLGYELGYEAGKCIYQDFKIGN